MIAVTFAAQITISQGDPGNTRAVALSIIVLRQIDYFLELLITPATLLFIGTRFLETRTLLSISFDTVDLEKMSVKGPDEENIVWIGRRYESVIEADAVAAALQRRLVRSDVDEA